MIIEVTLTHPLPGQPPGRTYILAEATDVAAVVAEVQSASRRLGLARLKFTDGGEIFVNPLHILSVMEAPVQ